MTTQLPDAANDNVVPLTELIPVLVVAKLTASEEVAASPNVVLTPTVCAKLAGLAKVIVCAAGAGAGAAPGAGAGAGTGLGVGVAGRLVDVAAAVA
ncbi:MAG: hypothetical protein ABL923_13865 [Burkholderiaceae bacterium]